jgi:uncharacterized protein
MNHLKKKPIQIYIDERQNYALTALARKKGISKAEIIRESLGELDYNTLREWNREKADEVLFLVDQLPIEVVDANRELTLDAARLKSTHPGAYADCFAAALALQKNAKVVTGDPEFKRFENMLSIEWLAP